MEYVSGGTLKHKLGKPLPHMEAAALLAPIARALEYAHQHKIIHRDIKPSNILLTESGQPMLSDFGIAKMLEAEETMDLTGTGVGVGTPEYMSPEQGLGRAVDQRADNYSLGIVFYELVTGRKPYQADTPMAVVVKQIHDPLPRPKQFVKELPDTVERVILKALAKEPQDRFHDMGAFATALENLAQGRRVSVGKVTRAPDETGRGVLSGRALLVVSALIVVAIAGALLWLNNRLQQTQASAQTTALRIAQIATQTANAPTVTPKPTSTIDLLVAATEQVRATQIQKTVVAATYYAQRTIIALTPSNTPMATPTRTRTPPPPTATFTAAPGELVQPASIVAVDSGATYPSGETMCSEIQAGACWQSASSNPVDVFRGVGVMFKGYQVGGNQTLMARYRLLYDSPVQVARIDVHFAAASNNWFRLFDPSGNQLGGFGPVNQGNIDYFNSLTFSNAQGTVFEIEVLNTVSHWFYIAAISVEARRLP